MLIPVGSLYNYRVGVGVCLNRNIIFHLCASECSCTPCLPTACESAVILLFDAVMHLGCKPYLDSQRETCICQFELNKEL